MFAVSESDEWGFQSRGRGVKIRSVSEWLPWKGSREAANGVKRKMGRA